MLRAQRHAHGSVRYDKRRGTWNYLFYDHGKRRSKLIGTKKNYPTKASAWNAVEGLRESVSTPVLQTLTINKLIEQYRVERMPTRKDTRRSYETFLGNHIIPKWGNSGLSALEPRPVELWLESLALSPKSRSHLRSLLRNLWDYAAWSGQIPREHRNPMTLVRVKGCSKRTRQPRSLTVEEFHKFIQQLADPFRTMALLCCCLGLRISECLALRWSDVDWLGGRLTVERGIVAQNVDDVKTDESRKKLVIDRELLSALQAWKRITQFGKSSDWMFASPTQLGRLPWSYHYVRRVYVDAGKAVGIAGVGTHSMRHTYRSWLDSQGTPLGIQRTLMRHVNIATTMSYGESFSADMAEAHGKIVGLALNGAQTERKPS